MFANKFRLRVAESRLKKKSIAAIRKTSGCNLADAREIGLIFNASDPLRIEEVKKLVSSLQSQNVHVFVIGFVNEKKISDMNLLRSGFNFFSLANLTWFQKPVIPFIEDFLNRKFDILFDLDLENSFPLRYIATLSKAGMKVGRYFDGCEYLDFMIKLEPNNSIQYLIEQSVYYLNMLRKPAEIIN
jgi:hypothetical protein